MVVVRLIDVLTREQRKKVLTVEDSTYDPSCSTIVELLAWHASFPSKEGQQ